ncbi:hypothetical protein D3C78_1506330 [compost metagenome]
MLIDVVHHAIELIVAVDRGVVFQANHFHPEQRHQHRQRENSHAAVQAVDGQPRQQRRTEGISGQIALDEHRRDERHRKHQQQR